MKIGEVAQWVGVSVSTLRMYEQRGLIAAGRSPGGTRHYGEEELERLRAIVGLTRAEVAIDDLTALAQVRQNKTTGNAASRQVESILAEVEAELATRIEIFQAALADLQQARERLAGCHGCRKRPTRDHCTGCAVADELLETRVMHVVWDEEGAA